MKMYLIIAFFFTLETYIWSIEIPKISIPTENAVIKEDNLFIFVQPNPIEIEQESNIKYSIFKRTSGNLIAKGIITSIQNYQWRVPIKDWKKGEYLLKVVYVNNNGLHISKASWRNFIIQ